LLKFDISNNNIGAEGGNALAAVLKDNQVITDLNFTSNHLGANSDMSGVIAIAAVIGGMGGLTSLHLANNELGQIVLAAGWRSKYDVAGYPPWVGPDGQEQQEKPGKPEGAIAFSDAIRIHEMGALRSLHVGLNQIPEKEMMEIMDIVASKESIEMFCEVPFKDKTLSELDVSRKNLGTEGALVVAKYLHDNEALTRLSMSKNKLGTKEAGQALGNMLKANSILTELDVSNNTEYDGSIKYDGSGFAQGVSKGLTDNRALTKFNISKCELMAEGGKALAAGLKGNQVITELNISNNDLLCWKSGAENADTSGIIAIADAIPDMRALTSLNLSSNHVEVQGAKAVAEAIKVTVRLKKIPFACRSDVSFNCWCLPISTGQCGVVDTYLWW
jgi:Ran GTPase-activating protein (RanGAP) involved in mRNA processing and transport